MDDQSIKAIGSLHAGLSARTQQLRGHLRPRPQSTSAEGSTYVADDDGDSDGARSLRPLQAAACTYRIAFGSRAGQKVLTLQGTMPTETDFKQTLFADKQGFSLHAAVRCGADDRQALEQLCRYIIRPALTNERVQTNAAGQVVLKPKSPWRDGTTHLVMSPLKFLQRHIDGQLCGIEFCERYVSSGSACDGKERDLAGAQPTLTLPGQAADFHGHHRAAEDGRPPAAALPRSDEATGTRHPLCPAAPARA